MPRFIPSTLILASILSFVPSCRADADLPSGAVAMHREVIKDDKGNGLDAFTLLIPHGWTLKSDVISDANFHWEDEAASR